MFRTVPTGTEVRHVRAMVFHSVSDVDSLKPLFHVVEKHRELRGGTLG